MGASDSGSFGVGGLAALSTLQCVPHGRTRDLDDPELEVLNGWREVAESDGGSNNDGGWCGLGKDGVAWVLAPEAEVFVVDKVLAGDNG